MLLTTNELHLRNSFILQKNFHNIHTFASYEAQVVRNMPQVTIKTDIYFTGVYLK